MEQMCTTTQHTRDFIWHFRKQQQNRINDNTLVHIILKSNFFLINWIGKHSYSIGYMEISIFVKTEEAPALNFLIRVLTPIVYIIIVSTTLYHFGLDKFVCNVYLVNIYYILFRLIFNLATNRRLLLNLYRQFLYWIAIVVISLYLWKAYKS